MAACLALRLGCPLRLVQTRPENLLSMQARDQQQRITLAADHHGIVTALEAEVSADVGGYSGMGTFEPLQTQRLLPGPYRIDQVAVNRVGGDDQHRSHRAVSGSGSGRGHRLAGASHG